MCRSTWGVGSSFVFLVALDKKIDQDTGESNEELRCRNPSNAQYPKIKYRYHRATKQKK